MKGGGSVAWLFERVPGVASSINDNQASSLHETNDEPEGLKANDVASEAIAPHGSV